MRTVTRVLAAAAAVLSAAAGYGYVPKADGITWLPRVEPSGSVEVTSFGDAELTPSELPPMQTLHVRFTVANTRDEQAWVVDLRTVVLAIGEAEATPRFINSDALGLPLVAVRRYERRIFDLYYALPDGIDLAEIDSVAVRWEVTIGPGSHEGTIALTRSDQPPPRSAHVLRTGWGSRWWADPTHPWPLFYRGEGPIVHRAPARAEVTRAPAGEPKPYDHRRY